MRSLHRIRARRLKGDSSKTVEAKYRAAVEVAKLYFEESVGIEVDCEFKIEHYTDSKSRLANNDIIVFGEFDLISDTISLYTARVVGDRLFMDCVETVCHELVHYMQKKRGDIHLFHFRPFWKGVSMSVYELGTESILDLPWEVEPYSTQAHHAESAIKHLVEKHSDTHAHLIDAIEKFRRMER